MSRTVPHRGAHAHPAPFGAGAGAGLYAEDGARKYLNAAERRRALIAMEGLSADRLLFAQTLAFTGARVSEVLELTPASFQIEQSVIAVRTLKRRRFVVRELPMPADLMAALSTHFDLAAAQANPERQGRRLWSFSRTTAWRLIKEVMAQAGVQGRQACPRGLRHGFGVGTLQSGVPLTLVQRWLGHARLSTTAIYADVTGPEERSFAKRFWDASEAEQLERTLDDRTAIRSRCN